MHMYLLFCYIAIYNLLFSRERFRELSESNFRIKCLEFLVKYTFGKTTNVMYSLEFPNV